MPIPNRNPNAGFSLPNLANLAIEKALLNVSKMLPAKIKSYDSSKNRAVIEICYKTTMSNGSIHNLVAPAQVPVMVAGGGGFYLSWPLKAGDLGWILAADRDISLFLRTYEAQPGKTRRYHSFEDGVFIPDVMHSLVSVSDTGVCLQHESRRAYLHMESDRIVLSAGGTFIEITSGSIRTNGTISGPGATFDGKRMETHTHTDSRGGKTSGPL